MMVRAVTQGVAAAALLLAGAISVLSMSVNNGDMSFGYIDAAGDTIPEGWGNSAHKKGCDAYYDQVDYVSAPASFKVFAPDSCYTSYVQNMARSVTPGEYGQEFTLTGWAKHTDIEVLQVATLRACVGSGGYGQLPGYWQDAYRGQGTSDWAEFSQTRTIPTVEECSAAFPGMQRDNPAVVIHLLVKNTVTGLVGTVNVDDLQVTVAGTRIDLVTGEITKLPAVHFANGGMEFVSESDYVCAIHTPQGRLVRNLAGRAKHVDLRPAVDASGVYVVRVKSSVGNMAHMLRIEK
jgi:hypothetical protein